jgi:murein DD-endopeptidase MepM/ murein hydrolase activator NlpD
MSVNKILEFIPSFQWKKLWEVNLDQYARESWLVKKEYNPFIDPDECKSLVEEIHRKLWIDVSYGWYGENRMTLWSGTYLKDPEKSFHLGIDINAPIWTPIHSPFNGEILYKDNDYPEDHGWGNRLITSIDSNPDFAFIFAHLAWWIRWKVGDIFSRWQVIWLVWNKWENGWWFPHLHIQAVKRDILNYLFEERRLKDLDWYGSQKDLQYQSPNPLIVY